MDVYERYCALRDRAGLTDSKIASMADVTKSTFTDWKTGRSKPKLEKINRIASVLDVSTDYLLTGKDTEKESNSGKKYYFSDETAQIAQEMFDRPDLRILMDATRDVSADSLKLLINMAEKLKETNPDG